MKRLLSLILAATLAACGGGGGGGSPSTGASTPATPVVPASTAAAPVTPIAVQATSYLNKVTAAGTLGPQALPSEVAVGNAVAFADFFQDGSYSMVTHTLEYNPQDPSTANKFGHVHFYKKVNGSWVDHTSDILANNVGCLHPRKAVVADFNGDGKPDVLFACHGFDASPYPGEQMHLLLSQPNGSYNNVILPFTGYFHGAAAADFSGKGFADIAVVDPIVAGTPYFLTNNGDGTFTKNTTRLTCAACLHTQIYSAEFIDFNNTGQQDLFLAGSIDDGTGHVPNPFTPTIFKNNGDNTYSQTNETVLPTNPYYQTTLDVLSVNGAIYTNNVHLTFDSAVYGYSDIEKIQGNTTTQIWSNTAPLPNGWTWLNWIIPYQGKIASMDSVYGVSVAQ